jgi:uncharacterized protein (TIRG00374 family)
MYYVLFITALNLVISALIIESLFLSADFFVPFIWVLIVFITGAFIGGITTIPGGLGVREAAMILLFNELGVPNETNVIVVLLSRLVTLIPMTIGYILSLRLGISFLKNT